MMKSPGFDSKKILTSLEARNESQKFPSRLEQSSRQKEHPEQIFCWQKV